MTTFTGPPSTAIRNKPITAELKQVLDTAARVAGVDAIRITSGGQDALGEGTRRTGATRADARGPPPTTGAEPQTFNASWAERHSVSPISRQTLPSSPLSPPPLPPA